MGSLLSIGSKASEFENGHGNVFDISRGEDLDSKLSEAKASGTVVLIDFTASWCGPCKFITPFLTQLSLKYRNLLFLKIDVDQHSDISEKYGIRAMPTFVFIEGDKEADRLMGANKSELEKRVKHFSQKTTA